MENVEDKSMICQNKLVESVTITKMALQYLQMSKQLITGNQNYSIIITTIPINKCN